MANTIKNLNITQIGDKKILLNGEINRDNVLDLVEFFAENQVPYYSQLEIDISELKIESGLTLLTLTNTLGALAKRVSSLSVSGAPKSLHNSLYSTGLLSGSSPIALINIKEDEAAFA